jgi:hypothetical protein
VRPTAAGFPDTVVFLATHYRKPKMNEQLDSEQDLPIQDQMIDQLTIIRGCVQLVLLRYPGDLFLSESLGRVMSATERLTELARK